MKLLNLFIMMVMLSCASLNAFSQDKKATILTIDGEAVTLEEFDNIFRKNNRDSVITQTALDEYRKKTSQKNAKYMVFPLGVNRLFV